MSALLQPGVYDRQRRGTGSDDLDDEGGKRLDGADVPSVVNLYGSSYTTLGTSDSAETAAELVCLFPTPLDDAGHPIRPDMANYAMLRKDNPHIGVSHLTVSNGWQNPANRIYRLRALYAFWRNCFAAHLFGGGSVYRHSLSVPTTAVDDAVLVKDGKKAWDAIRKRFARWGTPSPGDALVPGNPFTKANHRTNLMFDDGGGFARGDDGKCVPMSRSWDWTSPPVLYRWLSVDTPSGAFQVIYSSAPAYDGHEPEADPVSALLADMECLRPLTDPYPRRDAHGGPDDAWHPPKRATSEWKTVGRRSARALLDERQDTHDDLAAAANGVTSWRATQREMEARNPEGILQTRHFRASPEQPRDHLITLFESIGFDIFPGAREWALGEDTTARATPKRERVYTTTTEAGRRAWEKRRADTSRGDNHG